MKTIDYTNYKKPSDFMKFSQGDNLIRIISTGVIGMQHGMKTANRYINLGLCSEDNTCEHCNAGHEPKMVWKWIIFDYSDSRVKLLDAGPMIGNQVCDLASKNGDPQEYDLLINKKGEGFKTLYVVSKAVKNMQISETDSKTFEFRKKRILAKYFIKKESK